MNLAKKIIAGFTQVVLSLAALAIVVKVLFGKNFLTDDFITNLMALIQQIGDAGLMGLIALAVILWIFAISRSESGSSGV